MKKNILYICLLVGILVVTIFIGFKMTGKDSSNCELGRIANLKSSELKEYKLVNMIDDSFITKISKSHSKGNFEITLDKLNCDSKDVSSYFGYYTLYLEEEHKIFEIRANVDNKTNHYQLQKGKDTKKIKINSTTIEYWNTGNQTIMQFHTRNISYELGLPSELKEKVIQNLEILL